MNNYVFGNRVHYKGDLALVTKDYGDEQKVDISVLTSDSTKCYDDVNVSELSPIPINANTLKDFNLPVAPSRYILEYERGKYEITIDLAGFYSVKVDSNEVENGQISYIHELQNLVNKYTGRCFV